MKQLELIIDVDAILIDLLRPWLTWYNNTHDDNINIDMLTTYKIEKHALKGPVYEFFDDIERYADCPPLPGAAEAMSAFQEAGHDITIVTATAGDSGPAKYGLIKKVAPFIQKDKIHLESKKEKYKGDVFIDDAPKNIVAYRNAHPESHIMTIAYPYNQDVKSLVNCFAPDHNNTVQAWQLMRNHVQKLAEQ